MQVKEKPRYTIVAAVQLPDMRDARSAKRWPMWPLIGYTNAGKSTLMRALTVGDAAAQDEREAALRTDFPACIVMSARRAGDVSLLREAMTGLCEQFGQM